LSNHGKNLIVLYDVSIVIISFAIFSGFCKNSSFWQNWEDYEIKTPIMLIAKELSMIASGFQVSLSLPTR